MCGMCDHACENEAVVLGELAFGVFNIEWSQKINSCISWASKRRHNKHRNRMLNNVFLRLITTYRCWTKALAASVPWCKQIWCACSRYRGVIESLTWRIIGNLANCNSSGANCSQPCDLSIPFLSKYGFRDRILHLESSLRPLLSKWIAEWKTFSCEIRITWLCAWLMSFAVYCSLLFRSFLILKRRLWTVASVSSAVLSKIENGLGQWLVHSVLMYSLCELKLFCVRVPVGVMFL